MASLGGALTGQDDEADKPLTSILSGARNAASSTGEALFGDPRSRAALLQIGLNLMQPVGFGQTGLGHLASSIGSGGDLVSRQEKEDLERQKLESEEDYKARMATSREKEAEAYMKGQELSKVDRALQLEQLKQQGRLGLQQAKDYSKSAKEMFDFVNGFSYDPKDPDMAPFKQYRGKQPAEIEAMLRRADPQAAGGGAPTERQQALDWARANPNDPRAARILERLGAP